MFWTYMLEETAIYTKKFLKYLLLSFLYILKALVEEKWTSLLVLLI